MEFRKSAISDWSLLDTAVENIFINEYMINAPGDYTKVYLYGLMCSGIGMDISDEVMASQMNIRKETVNNAWEYWEQLGAVRRSFDDEGEIRSIEFNSLKEAMYGMLSPVSYGEQDGQSQETMGAYADDPQRADEEEVDFAAADSAVVGDQEQSAPEADGSEGGHAGDDAGTDSEGASSSGKEHESLNMIDEDFRDLCQAVSQILGRPLMQQELSAINSWLADYRVSHEVILYAYTYCKNINKDHYKYVGAVVRRWAMEDLHTAEDVEEYLSERDQKYYQYKRIFKALGFMRNPTEKERRIMDSWTDDLGFSMEKIIDACGRTSGIPNPNINYVNKILHNWAEEREEKDRKANEPVTVGQVMQYYEYLRQKEEKEAELRRREVYSKVPEIEQIDKEMAEAGAMASRVMLSGRSNRQQLLDEIKARGEDLSVKKAWLLTENGFAHDYTERRYKCSICSDTGIDNEGSRCRCFPERMQEAEEWINSGKRS